jgi:16S rRNA (adenine1518-N6/adenine1519-N6)-dimethyltransferase
MLQYKCKVEWLLHVPPESFSPPPKVDSAVVRLTPYATPRYTCVDEARLQQVLTAAFNMRRKTLRNALKGMIPAEWLDEAGIDAGLRPEEVDVAAWVALANRLATQEPGKHEPS